MSTTSVTLQIAASDQSGVAVASAQGRFVALSKHVAGAFMKIEKASKDAERKTLGFWEQLGARIIGTRFAIQSIATIISRTTAPIRRVAAEMHELTDRADEVGAKASDILRLSGAFDKLGIKHSGVEDIARLFNLMRKSTGDAGVEGFKRQMSAIAGIADETERAKELTRVFGSEGITLWNLAARGPEAFRKTVDAAMAAVTAMSDESIQVASQVHKGFAWIAADIKGRWNGMIASMVEGIVGELGGTVEMQMALWWSNFVASAERLNALVGSLLGFIKDGVVELVKFNVSSTWNVIKTIGGMAAEFGKQFWDLVTGGDFDMGPIVERLKRGLAEMPKFKLDMSGTIYQGMIDEIDERQAQRDARIREHFADKIAAGPVRDFEEIADAGVAAAAKISDAWKGTGAILAGSYEAVKTQALRSFGAVGRAVTGARDAIRGASTSSASASSQDRNLSNILARLADLLTVQREGWTNVQGALDAVRTV